jgi:dodecin
MSVVKVIELIAESDKSWDDAARNAVAEAARTVKGITSVWVDNFSAEVTGDKLSRYRVNVKISFIVQGHN